MITHVLTYSLIDVALAFETLSCAGSSLICLAGSTLFSWLYSLCIRADWRISTILLPLIRSNVCRLCEGSKTETELDTGTSV